MTTISINLFHHFILDYIVTVIQYHNHRFPGRTCVCGGGGGGECTIDTDIYIMLSNALRTNIDFETGIVFSLEVAASFCISLARPGRVNEMHMDIQDTFTIFCSGYSVLRRR